MYVWFKEKKNTSKFLVRHDGAHWIVQYLEAEAAGWQDWVSSESCLKHKNKTNRTSGENNLFKEHSSENFASVWNTHV